MASYVSLLQFPYRILPDNRFCPLIGSCWNNFGPLLSKSTWHVTPAHNVGIRCVVLTSVWVTGARRLNTSTRCALVISSTYLLRGMGAEIGSFEFELICNDAAWAYERVPGESSAKVNAQPRIPRIHIEGKRLIALSTYTRLYPPKTRIYTPTCWDVRLSRSIYSTTHEFKSRK
jgi:hypothetical protein